MPMRDSFDRIPVQASFKALNNLDGSNITFRRDEQTQSNCSSDFLCDSIRRVTRLDPLEQLRGNERGRPLIRNLLRGASFLGDSLRSFFRSLFLKLWHIRPGRCLLWRNWRNRFAGWFSDLHFCRLPVVVPPVHRNDRDTDTREQGQNCIESSAELGRLSNLSILASRRSL